MIEQGIYFALGCIITALAALMFAPVFWSRALRLTRRRLQLQVPLSMQEILAERDQLRAEFAVERLRIEQAAAKVEASKAADMAEIGRRSMETAGLQDDLASLRLVEQAQAGDIDRMTRDLAEAEAESSTLKIALDAAFARIERWRQRAYSSAEKEERLRDDLEADRATIAGLETLVMGLKMRLVDTERSAAARLEADESGLRSRLEAAMGHATRHETSAISLRRECDDAKTRIRSLEDDLDAIRQREQALQLQNSLRTRDADRTQAERLAQMQAENAALRDALGAARQGTGSPSGDASGSDEDLRSSIHALGLAVAMMTRRASGATAERAVARSARVDAPSPVEAN